MMAEVKLGELGEYPERTIPSQAKEIMKVCKSCGNEFQQRGHNHKRCDPCARTKNLVNMRQWRLDNVVTGQGSGALPGKDNPSYKDGLFIFRTLAKQRLKDNHYCCERCGKTIENLRYGWAGHHKDHDRTHNTEDNLEVVCKRCHQIEHKCWEAFEGVTTIPKGSRVEILQAPSPETSGDDIV